MSQTSSSTGIRKVQCTPLFILFLLRTLLDNLWLRNYHFFPKNIIEVVTCTSNDFFHPILILACPPEFKATNEDVHYGVEGSSCKVILGVKGYPLPSTSWFFMGTEVDYGNSFKAHISPNGNATLEIIKLTKDLVGEYKCTAENEHGTATKVVRLQLAGKETWKDISNAFTLKKL